MPRAAGARELLEETGLRVRRITDVLGGFDYATRTKAQRSMTSVGRPSISALDKPKKNGYRFLRPDRFPSAGIA